MAKPVDNFFMFYIIETSAKSLHRDKTRHDITFCYASSEQTKENRARITLSSGRIVDDEKIRVKTRVPAAIHSQPYNDPQDSTRYQSFDPLKERERRPAMFVSVFDRLGNEADSHQKKTPFHDSCRVGSHLRDPLKSFNNEAVLVK
ncbi:hypothetical protein Fot_21980 [Forsythia ovata]|uniref:Uncharacterized protein n=1 Tax=Forsythia ovata TaxID=205694 RepID=A0ABD1UWE1_9LAMI